MKTKQATKPPPYKVGIARGRALENKRIRRMVVSMRVSALMYPQDDHAKGMQYALHQLLTYMVPKR